MEAQGSAAGTGTSEQKRWFARYPVDFRVRLLAGSGDARAAYLGRAHDLSEGGMGLYMPAELALESKAEIEFTLPSSRQPIRLMAKVCTREGFKYGLEFLTLSSAQREMILAACGQKVAS